MFCPNCGASLPDSSVFCPNCGMSLGNQAGNNFAQNGSFGQQGFDPMYVDQARVAANDPEESQQILTFGILSLALAWLGLIGLVFGIINRVKAKAMYSRDRVLFGVAKAGNILGRIGMVFSIIFTVWWTLILFLFLLPAFA